MIKSVTLSDVRKDYSNKNVKRVHPDFYVTINGQAAECYQSRCSKVPFNKVFDDEMQRNIDQTELLGHICFEADEEVRIEVESRKPFSRALVRPLAKNVAVKTEANKASFLLKEPGQYCLELDDEHTCLCIFFNPIRSFEERSYYTHYFAAGNYFVGVLDLKSNDKVYIDKDAVVYGSIYAKDADNIVIEGYGTVNGCVISRVDTGFFNRGNLMFENCRNIRINGVILQDSAFWVSSFFNCENIEIDNIKITGQWRFNTDGIDLVNCRNVTVKNSFLHTFDDTLVIKAYSQFDDVTIETVENIVVQNCVMWCNWGRTLEIGIETVAKEYRNIRFSDCDLIHNSAAAIDIQNGNCAVIHDVIAENINVEFQASTLPEVYQSTNDMKYNGDGKIGMPYLIWIDNHKYASYICDEAAMEKLNAYTDDANVFGRIKDIVIRNVNVYAEAGLPKFKIKLWSEDPNGSFENIVIENIFVNGEQAEADRFDCRIDERIQNLRLFR